MTDNSNSVCRRIQESVMQICEEENAAKYNAVGVDSGAAAAGGGGVPARPAYLEGVELQMQDKNTSGDGAPKRGRLPRFSGLKVALRMSKEQKELYKALSDEQKRMYDEAVEMKHAKLVEKKNKKKRDEDALQQGGRKTRKQRKSARRKTRRRN
jgi:hypothetical protein